MENGLRGISHIIIDNVHEFDTNIVFLMAILKDMSYNYPDLRIILMFAATNTNIFSTYFYGCPVIDIGEYNYHVKGIAHLHIGQIKFKHINYVMPFYSQNTF